MVRGVVPRRGPLELLLRDRAFTAAAPGQNLPERGTGPLDIYQLTSPPPPNTVPLSFKLGRQELVYGDQRLVVTPAG